MGLVTIAHFIPEEKSAAEGNRGAGRIKRTGSDYSSKSMRGRFGSPIFGREHFRALQTWPPPRIELSVQISILTANLPANNPLLHGPLLLPTHRLFSINDHGLNAGRTSPRILRECLLALSLCLYSAS
ncbi:hypothetical protein KM043_013313 [Ampulex compressa]|nr:hypothetical protein KM043_013313 [Ampulex compressa]